MHTLYLYPFILIPPSSSLQRVAVGASSATTSRGLWHLPSKTIPSCCALAPVTTLPMRTSVTPLQVSDGLMKSMIHTLKARLRKLCVVVSIVLNLIFSFYHPQASKHCLRKRITVACHPGLQHYAQTANLFLLLSLSTSLAMLLLLLLLLLVAAAAAKAKATSSRRSNHPAARKGLPQQQHLRARAIRHPFLPPRPSLQARRP